MIVRFRSGNMTETRPVHEKLDHHVSAARKRDGYKQLPVSVEFTTNYKNIYLICIFLIRFIFSVHIIQVFYNINTQRRRLFPLFYKSVIRNLAADTKR